MKKENPASQFQRMKDEYLRRKENPEVIRPEDMRDEEYLKYMSSRMDKDQDGRCRRNITNLLTSSPIIISCECKYL